MAVALSAHLDILQGVLVKLPAFTANNMRFQMKGFSNIPVRFFVVDIDHESGEQDLFEVGERDFTNHPGNISYSRSTVRENGVSQIELIKGLDA